MFRFRPLTSGDFPLLLEWLSKEHVRQCWHDGDDTLEKSRDIMEREDKT
jgi:hypothetical protein